MAGRRNASGDKVSIIDLISRRVLKKGRGHLRSAAQRSSSSSPSGCEDLIFTRPRVHADDFSTGWQYVGNGSGSPLSGGHRQGDGVFVSVPNGSSRGYNSPWAGTGGNTPLRVNYGQGEDAHSPPRKSSANGSHHSAGSVHKVLKVLGANMTETKDIMSYVENGCSPTSGDSSISSSERSDRHSDSSPRGHMVEGRGAHRPRTLGQHIDLDAPRRSHSVGPRAVVRLERFPSDGVSLYTTLVENEDSDSRSLSPKSNNSPGEDSVTTLEQSSASTPQLSPRADGHRSPVASPRGTHACMSPGGRMNGAERLHSSYGMMQGSNQVALTDATRHPLPAPPPSSPRSRTTLGARSPARTMMAAEEFRQREHVENRTRSSQQVSHVEITALREGLRGIDMHGQSPRQSPHTRFPRSPRMTENGVYSNGKLPAGKNGVRHMDQRQTARMSPQPSPQQSPLHSPRVKDIGPPAEDLHSPPHPSTSTSPRPSMDRRLPFVDIPPPQPSASASVPMVGTISGMHYSPYPSPHASPQVSPRMDQSSIYEFPNHRRTSLLPNLSPPPSPHRSPQPSTAPAVSLPRKWRRGEVLGRGTFGTVYEGHNVETGGFFAVKISEVEDISEAVRQEVSLLSQLSHPNIVQYLGASVEKEHLYIFLELMKLGSLQSLLKTYKFFDEATTRKYTRQILEGLSFLHQQNTIHRDIKCANILVDATGQVKLADFGMAKKVDKSIATSCKGTPYYMAPEVFKSSRENSYGPAVDIWSLGCTVLEMIEGKAPWANHGGGFGFLFKIIKGELPPIPGDLSIEAKDFIKQCLQLDPEQRPTAEQLLQHPFVTTAHSSPVLPSPSASPHYSEAVRRYSFDSAGSLAEGRRVMGLLTRHNSEMEARDVSVQEYFPSSPRELLQQSVGRSFSDSVMESKLEYWRQSVMRQ